jgi:hypothetical protein
MFGVIFVGTRQLSGFSCVGGWMFFPLSLWVFPQNMVMSEAKPSGFA